MTKNIGLISVLKILFSNPESVHAKFKAESQRKALFKEGISNALSNNPLPGARLGYAKLLANILADLAIVTGAALIIAAIVMTSFPVPVLPALMVIGLMMIAAATVTRAITSLIHKFDINKLRPYNWIGNTLVIASAGLMIASIFFPPLLLPLLVSAAAGLIVGSGTLIYGSYNYTKNSSPASKIPSSSASSDGSDESNASSTKNITINLARSTNTSRSSSFDGDSAKTRNSVDSNESTVSMFREIPGRVEEEEEEDFGNRSRTSSLDSSASSASKTWRLIISASTDSIQSGGEENNNNTSESRKHK